MADNVLIKISGDLINKDGTYRFIREHSMNAFVVVLVGGGSDITDFLRENGSNSRFVDGTGRFIEDFEARQEARNILERNQHYVQDKLVEMGINAVVEIPVRYVGGVLCHENGDNMATAISINFSRTYVLTLPEREKELDGYNIEVVKISD